MEGGVHSFTASKYHLPSPILSNQAGYFVFLKANPNLEIDPQSELDF